MTFSGKLATGILDHFDLVIPIYSLNNFCIVSFDRAKNKTSNQVVLLPNN